MVFLKKWRKTWKNSNTLRKINEFIWYTWKKICRINFFRGLRTLFLFQMNSLIFRMRISSFFYVFDFFFNFEKLTKRFEFFIYFYRFHIILKKFSGDWTNSFTITALNFFWTWYFRKFANILEKFKFIEKN